MAMKMKEKDESGPDAIALLKEDHSKVKKLFSQFEKAEDQAEAERIAEEAIKELKVHATVEEEIFYPAVREELEAKAKGNEDKEEEEEDLMNEAEEEHHVAKVLIAELEKMDKSDPHFCAKFIVLAENVRHHIKEEETEMLPEAKKTDIDMKELGRQMMKRKEELMAQELPPLDARELVEAGTSR